MIAGAFSNAQPGAQSSEVGVARAKFVGGVNRQPVATLIVVEVALAPLTRQPVTVEHLVMVVEPVVVMSLREVPKDSTA